MHEKILFLILLLSTQKYNYQSSWKRREGALSSPSQKHCDEFSVQSGATTRDLISSITSSQFHNKSPIYYVYFFISSSQWTPLR